MKTKTSIKYGGIELAVVNSQDSQVPKSASTVTLSTKDKSALAIAINANKPALLVGETGTGKTSAIRELAYITKRPYVRVNMTGFTTPDELIGSKSVKEGATYYEQGIVTDAMNRGAILVLDEINATTPDCMFILHGLLDDDRRITMPNGDVVVPHADFRVFATCNPDYEGTKALNKALLDRFSIIINVDVLSPAQEIALIVKRTGIDLQKATNLVSVATLLRKDYTENKIATYTSTRTLINIAELIGQGMQDIDAFMTGLARKTQNKEEQTLIRDVYCSVVKIDSKEQGATLDDDMPEITTVGEMKRLKEQNERANNLYIEERTKKDEAEKKLQDSEASRLETLRQAEITQRELLTKTERVAQLETDLSQYRWIDKRLKAMSLDAKGVNTV